MQDTPDDPMRVGDEDFLTPSQMLHQTMRDFDCIFSGRELPPETDAEKSARDEYWKRHAEKVARESRESIQGFYLSRGRVAV
jgi:hypothetical protein